MKRLLKLSILYIILPIIMAFSVLFYIEGGLRCRANPLSLKDDVTEPVSDLNGAFTMSQSFHGDSYNITGIDISMIPFGKSWRWKFSIIDEASGETISEKIVTAGDLDIKGFLNEKQFVRIEINAGHDVHGRALTLRIAAEAGSGSGPILYRNLSSDKSSRLLINGAEANGAIEFYVVSWISMADYMARVTQFKPGIIKGKQFGFVIFLFLYGLSVLFVFFTSVLFRPRRA